MAPIILILGRPGSGKGTQSAILAKKLGGLHISSGELLRQDAIGSKAIADGSLAESKDILRLLDKTLARISADQAIILDGVGRLPAELTWLEQELSSLGRKLNLVIRLEIPETGVVARLSGRAALEKRADDADDGIRRRLQLYKEVTEPTQEYWRNKTQFEEVDARGSVDDVAARVWKVVQNAA